MDQCTLIESAKTPVSNTNIFPIANPDFVETEERTVNLTNSSVNIDSSSNVVFGNVFHYFNGPITMQRVIPEMVEPENDENNRASKGPESPEETAVPPEEPSKNISIFPTRRVFVSMFIAIFILSIIGFLLIRLMIFDNTNPTELSTHNRVDEQHEPSKKPSYTFGNRTSLGQCVIIEEEDWGIKRNLEDIQLKLPVPLIIVSHSATPFCSTFETCRSRVAKMQEYHITSGSPDIGYNFVIGGDGNIYVGRGWNARNFHLGNHSIGINFVGNFFRDELNEKMIDCARSLIKFGEDEGKFTREYRLVGHNQTNAKTSSPGPNVIRVIREWRHYFVGRIDWNFLYLV